MDHSAVSVTQDGRGVCQELVLHRGIEIKARRGISHCEQCAVRRLTIFGVLNLEELQSIDQEIDDMQYARGQVVYAEGGYGDWIYSIKTGSVKLQRQLENGQHQITQVLGRGDVIGLESLIDQPYQHTACAIDDVRTCRIPMTTIRRLEEQAPALRDEWMRRWQSALRGTEDWASLLTHGTPRIRLARLLLKLANPDLNDFVTLPKRTDMGIMLGIAMETASRIIAQFVRNGLLRYVGPRQYQIKRSVLTNLCHNHTSTQPQRIRRNRHVPSNPEQPTLTA